MHHIVFVHVVHAVCAVVWMLSYHRVEGGAPVSATPLEVILSVWIAPLFTEPHQILHEVPLSQDRGSTKSR